MGDKCTTQKLLTASDQERINKVNYFSNQTNRNNQNQKSIEMIKGWGEDSCFQTSYLKFEGDDLRQESKVRTSHFQRIGRRKQALIIQDPTVLKFKLKEYSDLTEPTWSDSISSFQIQNHGGDETKVAKEVEGQKIDFVRGKSLSQNKNQSRKIRLMHSLYAKLGSRKWEYEPKVQSKELKVLKLNHSFRIQTKNKKNLETICYPLDPIFPYQHEQQKIRNKFQLYLRRLCFA